MIPYERYFRIKCNSKLVLKLIQQNLEGFHEIDNDGQSRRLSYCVQISNSVVFPYIINIIFAEVQFINCDDPNQFKRTTLTY